MNAEQAQAEFLRLLDGVKADQVGAFVQWIQTSFDGQHEDPLYNEASATIQQIQLDLKMKMPLDGVLPSERPRFPQTGVDSDCDPNTTVHVDSFLYDEDDIDSLVESGSLSRYYCRSCGAHVNAPLTFISHSLSHKQLKYMFTTLLPPEQLTDRVLLDVGSRLGAVLYAAYLYSPHLRSIVGVEINAELSGLQREMLDTYSMTDKCSVVASDVRAQPQLVNTADVVVLNNVFQFFLPPDEQLQCWTFLKEQVKSGSLLVTSPSLAQLTEHLPLPFPLDGWVEKLDSDKPAAKYAAADEDLYADCAALHLYKVK